MRRFVGFAVLFFLAAPLSISVIGCGHKSAPAQYCNAGDSGPVAGQVASISLSPTLATIGESLNYAEIGQNLSATAEDCKGNSVSVRSFVYSSTSSYNVNNSGSVFADINPSTGQVCGGTWNRNTGGGVADYTTCTAPTTPPVSTTVAANIFTTAAVVPNPNANPPIAAAASVTTLVPVKATDPISGTLTLTYPLLGTSGQPHSITLPAGSTIATLATQINSDTTFSAEGITAVAGTILTITGPVPPTLTAGNAATDTSANYTLVTTGTVVNDSTEANVAYVTATAQGVVSNAIPIYVHPKVTGIVLGGATAVGGCPTAANPLGNDPGTDCCPNSTVGTPVQAPVYTGSGCLSQTVKGQLIGRVYDNGTTSPANNITCQVGHISYAAQSGAGIVTIDQNGVATANQPGSTEITATLAGSSTGQNAGFFSTCPPANIVLSINGQPSGTTSVNVNLNNSQPLTATVTDTNGNTITGLNLEFNSTAPQNIPAGSGSITPVYPGSANITAVCQPNNCNIAPFSQIGLYGNGEPLTSNPITVTSTGTSSTVLYMASSPDTRTGSAGSLYITPYDFTVGQPSTPIKLEFVPNSMVINQAGSVIYVGSSQGLVTINTANNSATAPNTNVPGTVLSVSPDGTQLVVTDSVRQTVSLVAASSGSVNTTYGGTATSAVWTPDSQTVYITTNSGPNNSAYPTPTLLQYSLFTKWQPVLPSPDEVYTAATVTVPSVGAYFASATNTGKTEGRSYCAVGSQASPGPPPAISNSFAPLADTKAVPNDALFATSDGVHILGAHAVTGTSNSVLNDLEVSLPTNVPCPQSGTGGVTFSSSPFKKFLTGINASAITGVYASSNSVTSFVTYIGSGSVVPLYYPAATGAGTLVNVPLSGSATAPISGVFSTDNFTFYTGTTGDNAVHIISLIYPATGGTPTAADTGTLTPTLPAATGTGTAPVNLIVQYPKKAKS